MSATVVPDAIVAVQGVRSKIDNHRTVSDRQLVSQIESALNALAAVVRRKQ